MADSPSKKADVMTESPRKRRLISKVMVHKLVFVASIVLLSFSLFISALSPDFLFVIFTGIFIILMLLRFIAYSKSNNLLFMFGICYFVNVFSLIFIWAFPDSEKVFLVQFGLANGAVYSAIFFYRNTFAFHVIDKMTSCFIHILPPVFSYSIRWFPDKTSWWWYKGFVHTNGSLSPSVFNPPGDWIYILVIPNVIFILHTLIYHIAVHVIWKPNEKYADPYRYFGSHRGLVRTVGRKLPKNTRLIAWILFNIVTNAIVSLVSCLAWCTFVFHSLMMLMIVLVLSWNGACYYLDYFAFLALKKAMAQNNAAPDRPPISVDEEERQEIINSMIEEAESEAGDEEENMEQSVEELEDKYGSDLREDIEQGEGAFDP